MIWELTNFLDTSTPPRYTHTTEKQVFIKEGVSHA